MEGFLSFLKLSKSSLKSISCGGKNVHIVLGNESCDLDSSISSLILGYFLSKQKPNQTVIPIMNVSYDNFLLRTENCFVFREAGINLKDLVFRNEIDFQDVISKATVTASLVDHHILAKKDHILANNVKEIFDHRPIDSSYNWNRDSVSIRIEEVGSCSTLIAEEIINKNKDILSKPLAYLLYQTIIYDTIALKPENGKAKALDIKIGTFLEQNFNISSDRQILFDKLWTAHNDVSHLSPSQLLYKDLKQVGGIYIPGFPMLVEEYLQLDNAFEAVKQFAEEHKVNCILLCGLNAFNNSVKRDLAIYFKDKSDKLGETLHSVLTTSTEHDFQFEERLTKFDENITLLHVHNTKTSRKQLVPLVKKAWELYISENSL